MKVRDSGMPAEDTWHSFFDAECVVSTMFGEEGCRGHVVEIGSGYGTFTFAAANRTSGTVFAFDIEPELVERLRVKSGGQAGLRIHAAVRDVVVNGTGLESETVSHTMIYNLLHLEDPVALLKEAYRILQPDGKLSVIHWRRDIPTPRGPALDIRPSPEQCRDWMEQAGFRRVRDIDLATCCPYHFGIVASR